METMEENENKGKKSDKDGSTEGLGMVLFSTLNDAPFFTLNGAVLAYKSKDSSFYL